MALHGSNQERILSLAMCGECGTDQRRDPYHTMSGGLYTSHYSTLFPRTLEYGKLGARNMLKRNSCRVRLRDKSAVTNAAVTHSNVGFSGD